MKGGPDGMRNSLSITALTAIVLLWGAICSAEADVLATVDDATLTWEDLVAFVGGEENIAYFGIRSEADANELLMSWVREQLIIGAAESENIESNPLVAEALEQARRQVLLEAYLALAVEDVEVSQLEIENYLADWEESYRTEIHLAHILVFEQDLATSIRALLIGGSSFEDLAGQHSICPSSVGGGDLGWLRRGDAALPFEEAAYRLSPGEISGIVETSMGYHIIRMIDSRELSPAPGEDEIKMLVGAELLQYEQEQVLGEILDGLQAEHTVSLYPARLMDHIQ
jgi:peptidyl-prolyl cis-trans isomerase C